MNTRYLVTVIISAALLLGAVSAQAFVGTIAVGLGRANEVGEIKVQFSADAEIETEQGKFSSKMNYKNGKLRDVVNMGGQTLTTITRFDLDKSWTLLGQGMYIESEIGESERSPDYKLIERTIVGEEHVNGQDATKYKTIYESQDGKFGGFTWYNKDNIAVKGFMISEQDGEKTRIMFNLTNLVVGAQPDAVFELPAGAQPFTMPNFGSMKGLQGMGGRSAGTSMATSAGSEAAATANDTAGQPVDDGQQDPSIAAEAASAAEEGIREGVVEESKQTAKDAVKEGFRSIFRKKN